METFLAIIITIVAFAAVIYGGYRIGRKCFGENVIIDTMIGILTVGAVLTLTALLVFGLFNLSCYVVSLS